MAAADFFDTVQEIYIAYYQRPADPAGLRFWAERLDQNGGDLNEIIDSFGTSPEALGLYGVVDSQNIGETIDSIYLGLFGRLADAGGKAFYTEQFLIGRFTPASIALDILNGAQNEDADAIANKLIVANDFTQVIDGRDYSNPDFGGGGISQFEVSYSGPADAAAAREFLRATASEPETVPTQSETTIFIYDRIADFPGARAVLTLQEATETVTSTTVTVIPGETEVETEIIVTQLDPIITKASYWISSENGGGVPLTDFYAILGAQGLGAIIDSAFGAINVGELFGTFNTSLGQIAAITLNGAGDIVQGEGATAGGVVPTATGGDGGDGGTGGADGTGGTGGSGGDAAANEDEVVKEGDYTGNYEMTITLDDGTVYDAVLELSASQFALLNSLLFDADGNLRFEERDVEVYSYMPLLARHPEGAVDSNGSDISGQLITWEEALAAGDVSGTTDSFRNINGYLAEVGFDPLAAPPVVLQLIPVKAYDIRVITTETVEDDTVITDTDSVEVYVPIRLTTTENNDATIESGLPTTSAIGDVIIAGRLELLHQAYIDGGQGYNILEVDAKGTYAQPLGLININEIRIENLPNVYTTPEGQGDGYRSNSSYPELSTVAAPFTTGISYAQFTTIEVDVAGVPTAIDVITINALNIRVDNQAAFAVPAGTYTAEQLIDLINTSAGWEIASVSAAGGVDFVAALDQEVYFSGSQADSLVLQDITGALDGLLTRGENSLIDLSRALDLQRIVITEGDFDNLLDSPSTEGLPPLGDAQLGELFVVGIRNGATASIEGSFTQPINLDYSSGMNPNIPLTIELNLGELTSGVAPILNISHNSNTLNLVSLGGGSNTFDAGDLGGNLSQVNISGNSRLDIVGDFGTSFTGHIDISTPTPMDPSAVSGVVVTVDASENTAGVSMLLGGSNRVEFVGSAGNDYLEVAQTVGFGISFVNVVDAAGDNRYVLDSGDITVNTGDGNNMYDLSSETGSDISVTAANGNVELVTDSGRDLVFAMGDGNLNTGGLFAIIAADRDVNITSGVGDVDAVINATRDIAATFGDGEINLSAAASGRDIFLAFSDGDTEVVAIAGRDLTINAGDGRSTFTTTSSGNTIASTGDGIHEFTVTTAAEVAVQTGEGDKTFDIGLGIAGIFPAIPDAMSDVTLVGVAQLVAGGGDNAVTGQAFAMGVSFGAGDSVVEARTGIFLGNFGDGNNNINVRAYDLPQGEIWESEDISDTTVDIVAGDGSNIINVAVDNLTIGGAVDGDGHYLKPAIVNITAGNGGNDISVPYDLLSGQTIGDVFIAGGGGLPLVELTITTGSGSDRIVASGSTINVASGGGGDDITLLGIDGDYAGFAGETNSTNGTLNDGALLNIDTGAGSATVRLGAYLDESFLISGTITAKEGSSITGENITLFVNTEADMRAATLSGITSVVLDDDREIYLGFSQANAGFDPEMPLSAANFPAPDTSLLTITDEQFVAIGADNFSVQGAQFNTYSRLQIIVTEDTSLTDLGVDDLPSNIDLVLIIKDGVTLEMTAQQLHERVAPEGVTLEQDGNTDLLSGSVVITGGGSDFDPFNAADTIRTTIAGSVYVGGSLSPFDFKVGEDSTTGVGGAWFNVELQSIFRGYDRPQDAEVITVLTIDADLMAGDPVDELSTYHTLLEIVGDQDVTFESPILLGMDDSTTALDTFTIDFSALAGEVVNLTVDNFERFAQGGSLSGNSLSGFDAEVLIHIAADDIMDTVGWDEAPAPNGSNPPSGLVSQGVARLIVTQIDGFTAEGAPGSTATITLCDKTQDLDVFGFRGNYNDTLILQDISWSTDIELQGGSTRKLDGPQGTANVGTLDADFEWAGAPANINLVHSVAGDTREIRSFGLDVDNAATLNITSAESGAIFEYITGNDVENIVFNVAGDVTVSAPISLTDLEGGSVAGVQIEGIDAVGVTGDLTLALTGTTNPAGFDFVASAGTTSLLMSDVTAGFHSSFSAEDAATFLIGVADIEGGGATDLSASTLTNVDAIGLGGPGGVDGTVVLSIAQIDDIGQANIGSAHPGALGTVVVADFGSGAFDSTGFTAGTTTELVTAAGDIAVDAATSFTNVSSFTLGATTGEVTMDAAQLLELLQSLAVANPTVELADLLIVVTGSQATINLTGVTQAIVDSEIAPVASAYVYSFTEILVQLSDKGLAGTVTLAESVNLDEATWPLGPAAPSPDNDIDFDFILGDDMTLGLATSEQADDLVVTGGANSVIDLQFGSLDMPQSSG
ncbi:MAG: hypothetical protein ACI87W_001525, partial [Halieaceae bacterium]